MDTDTPARSRDRPLPVQPAPVRIRLLWRMILFLLIAVVVIAIGTSSGNPVRPDAASPPEPTTAELASRSMLDLADAASLLAEGAAAPGGMPGSTTTDSGTGDGAADGAASPGAVPSSSVPSQAAPPDPGTAAELQAVATLLRGHAALLTPGLPQPGRNLDAQDGGQDPAANGGQSAIRHGAQPAPNGGQSAIPHGAQLDSAQPATPAQVAMALAESGNRLVAAAVEAEPAAVRATLGAGIEQRLAATELAREAAGPDAVAALPDPDVPSAAQGWKAASGVVLGAGACAAGDAASAPAVTGSTGSPDESQDAAARDAAARAAGRAVAGSADAAFRLAYAYQLAAARLGPAHSAPAWAAATHNEELGRHLVALLPEPCAALRRPAYRLPADFDKHPMARAAAGEEQLAGLLRDAAAAAPPTVRAPLVRAAWDAARAGLARTGASPALT